jgi:hypothetical protein
MCIVGSDEQFKECLDAFEKSFTPKLRALQLMSDLERVWMDPFYPGMKEKHNFWEPRCVHPPQAFPFPMEMVESHLDDVAEWIQVARNRLKRIREADLNVLNLWDESTISHVLQVVYDFENGAEERFSNFLARIAATMTLKSDLRHLMPFWLKPKNMYYSWNYGWFEARIEKAEKIKAKVKVRSDTLDKVVSKIRDESFFSDDFKAYFLRQLMDLEGPANPWNELIARITDMVPILEQKGSVLTELHERAISYCAEENEADFGVPYWSRWKEIDFTETGVNSSKYLFHIADEYARTGERSQFARVEYLSKQHKKVMQAGGICDAKWLSPPVCKAAAITFLCCRKFAPAGHILKLVNPDVAKLIAKEVLKMKDDEAWMLPMGEDGVQSFVDSMRPIRYAAPSYSSYRMCSSCGCHESGGRSGLCNRCFYGHW